MNTNRLFAKVIQSGFGPVTVIWGWKKGETVVRRIFLAESGEAYLRLEKRSDASLELLADAIVRFLDGEEIDVPSTGIDLTQCSPFQLAVLKAEKNIPRGRISTYQRIAAAIGHPLAARAVGNALAGNPFPLYIPCHRAVRSDGHLGGFQGGLIMKRRLLEMEGITFRYDGRIQVDSFIY